MNATPITDALINADKITTGDVARAMRALELEVYELRAWKSGGEMSRDECNARRVQLEQELERARQDRNSAAMEVRRQFLPLLELAESALRLATDELQTECEKVVELMDKLGVAERERDEAVEELTVEAELHNYRVKCHEAIRQAALQSAELAEWKACAEQMAAGFSAVLERDYPSFVRMRGAVFAEFDRLHRKSSP